MTHSYLADILDQPRALRDLHEARPHAALSRYADHNGRIVLTGMGASLAALMPAWMTFVAAGAQAWLIETAQLIHDVPQLLSGRTLLIAASQSGRSAETLALIERIRPPTMLIAMTNDAASPLAAAAAAVVDIRAGAEHAVSTRSYVNTLAAAELTAGALTDRADGRRYDLVADELDAYLADSRARIDSMRELIGAPSRLYLLGRGRSLAAAQCGALVIKEAAKWPAEAMSCPQFRHGPLELADEQLTTIVLAGDEPRLRRRNYRLHEDLLGFGAQSLWADDQPSADIALSAGIVGARPIGEIAALQLVSVAIAEETGTPAGEFRHLSKVTTVE